jgi:hypothetical protein
LYVGNVPTPTSAARAWMWVWVGPVNIPPSSAYAPLASVWLSVRPDRVADALAFAVPTAEEFARAARVLLVVGYRGVRTDAPHAADIAASSAGGWVPSG